MAKAFQTWLLSIVRFLFIDKFLAKCSFFLISFKRIEINLKYITLLAHETHSKMLLILEMMLGTFKVFFFFFNKVQRCGNGERVRAFFQGVEDICIN